MGWVARGLIMPEEGEGREGEIEDTVAFNIQAPVKALPIYFSAWMQE